MRGRRYAPDHVGMGTAYLVPVGRHPVPNPQCLVRIYVGALPMQSTSTISNQSTHVERNLLKSWRMVGCLQLLTSSTTGPQNKAEAGLAIWAVESARLYAGLVYILGLLDVQLGLVTRESPQLDHYYFCTRKEKKDASAVACGLSCMKSNP